MSRRLYRILAPLLVMLLLFASCSGGGDDGTAARMEELGIEFTKELDEIYIYNREYIPALLDQEAVVVTERTYNLEYLYNFYEDYKAGIDTQLVTVFKTTSYVVTKIVFENSVGYYFRYEYNPSDLENNEVVVTSELVSGVETAGDPDLNKVTLTIARPKKSSIEITYRNITDITEE